MCKGLRASPLAHVERSRVPVSERHFSSTNTEPTSTVGSKFLKRIVAVFITFVIFALFAGTCLFLLPKLLPMLVLEMFHQCDSLFHIIALQEIVKIQRRQFVWRKELHGLLGLRNRQIAAHSCKKTQAPSII